MVTLSLLIILSDPNAPQITFIPLERHFVNLLLTYIMEVITLGVDGLVVTFGRGTRRDATRAWPGMWGPKHTAYLSPRHSRAGLHSSWARVTDHLSTLSTDLQEPYGSLSGRSGVVGEARIDYLGEL